MGWDVHAELIYGMSFPPSDYNRLVTAWNELTDEIQDKVEVVEFEGRREPNHYYLSIKIPWFTEREETFQGRACLDPGMLAKLEVPEAYIILMHKLFKEYRAPRIYAQYSLSY